MCTRIRGSKVYDKHSSLSSDYVNASPEPVHTGDDDFWLKLSALAAEKPAVFQHEKILTWLSLAEKWQDKIELLTLRDMYQRLYARSFYQKLVIVSDSFLILQPSKSSSAERDPNILMTKCLEPLIGLVHNVECKIEYGATLPAADRVPEVYLPDECDMANYWKVPAHRHHWMDCQRHREEQRRQGGPALT